MDIEKLLDMSENEQWDRLEKNLPLVWERKLNAFYCLYNGKEICCMADLAFRLHNGKIAGKKPIEHIVDALIAKEQADE